MVFQIGCTIAPGFTSRWREIHHNRDLYNRSAKSSRFRKWAACIIATSA